MFDADDKILAELILEIENGKVFRWSFVLCFMKKIKFNFSGEKLVFETSQSLFSSASVDNRTKVLLNSLRKNKDISYEKILDVGCGYGALGIFLKKQNSGAEVLCTDRDSLAVKFVERNAKINEVDVKTKWAIGYNNVTGKFNVIVSNFPAKAGLNALKDFVYGASYLLNKDGIFAIVIVSGLESDFEKVLNENIDVVYHETSSGYLIYHLKFKKIIKFFGESYFRNKIRFLDYEMKTAYNLPEFDTPSFSTELFLEFLKEMSYKNISIINPNQGHVALGALKFLEPEKINLISRDLLSLEFSKENLLKNGFENIGDGAKADLVIWNVNADEEFELFSKRLDELKKCSERILIGGKSNMIQRFLKKNGIEILEEKKNHGFIVVAI